MQSDQTIPTVTRLAAALADGAEIDWEHELATAATPEERAAVEQIRVVASLSRVHQQQFENDAQVDAHATVGTSPPSGGAPPTGRWGHLDVLEELGRGTSCTVYRAWDRRLARHVALKLLTSTDTDAASALSEAQRLARVRHSSVVTVFGADYIDGVVGLWMELLEGRTLEQILRTDGPFSPREALGIGQDVCAALAAVHGAGLLHRDVKAQNIIREKGGRIVLMDFGAGREFHSTELVPAALLGTPMYMAPELFGGQPATVRSDLYSVGVLLFRLVSGRFPIEGQNLADVRRAHESDARRDVRDVRPDVPAALADVIHRALARAPEERFDSAARMARALATASSDLSVSMHHQLTSEPPPAADSRRGSPRLIAIAIALTVVVTAAAVLAIEHGPRALWARLSGSGWNGATATAAQSAEPHDAPAVGMSPQQRGLVAGFEELAGALGEKGDWAGAAGLYDQIRAVYRESVGDFSPINAVNIARSAWARHRAGELDAARYLYEEALVKLEQLLGDVHPYRATTMAALARLHQQAGRHEETAVWLDRALTVRRAVLGLPAADGNATQRIATEQLAAMSARAFPLLDEDGDWIPSLIEAAIGLNPRSSDTDADGLADGDEDQDADGRSNCLEHCITVDPTKIVAHYGSTNPRRLGFFRHYGFEAAPVEEGDGTASAWRMSTGPIGYYFQRLTTTQKQQAVAGGWRLTLRGRVRSNLAYALVDLTPFSARWDIVLSNAARRRIARLATSVVPFEGPEVEIEDTEHYPLSELVYSPASRTAQFYVNGKIRATGYPGTRQFQDDRGLIFGSGSRTNESSSGEADFALIALEIR